MAVFTKKRILSISLKFSMMLFDECTMIMSIYLDNKTCLQTQVLTVRLSYIAISKVEMLRMFAYAFAYANDSRHFKHS